MWLDAPSVLAFTSRGRGPRLAPALCLAGAVWCVGCPQPQESTTPAPKTDPLEEVSSEQLYATGAQLARQGDLLRSEQYLQAAVARGHPEREVLPLLVEVCVRGSRWRAALQHAEPYLKRNPDDWRLRQVVATIHMALGRADRAVEHLERVTKQVPRAPTPHYLTGVALLRSDDPVLRTAAAEHFERYLHLAPEGKHAEEVRGELSASDSTRPDQEAHR